MEDIEIPELYMHAERTEGDVWIDMVISETNVYRESDMIYAY